MVLRVRIAFDKLDELHGLCAQVVEQRTRPVGPVRVFALWAQ